MKSILTKSPEKKVPKISLDSHTQPLLLSETLPHVHTIVAESHTAWLLKQGLSTRLGVGSEPAPKTLLACVWTRLLQKMFACFIRSVVGDWNIIKLCCFIVTFCCISCAFVIPSRLLTSEDKLCEVRFWHMRIKNEFFYIHFKDDLICTTGLGRGDKKTFWILLYMSK